MTDTFSAGEGLSDILQEIVDLGFGYKDEVVNCALGFARKYGSPAPRMAPDATMSAQAPEHGGADG